jgi:hypothetical protein
VKVLVHPGPHEVTLLAAIYIASQLNEIYIAFILLIGGWVLILNVASFNSPILDFERNHKFWFF